MLLLKEEREKLGLTQNALAKSIGKDRSLIAKIENGNTKPSVDTAKAISKVLGFAWTIFFADSRE